MAVPAGPPPTPISGVNERAACMRPARIRTKRSRISRHFQNSCLAERKSGSRSGQSGSPSKTALTYVQEKKQITQSASPQVSSRQSLRAVFISRCGELALGHSQKSKKNYFACNQLFSSVFCASVDCRPGYRQDNRGRAELTAARPHILYCHVSRLPRAGTRERNNGLGSVVSREQLALTMQAAPVYFRRRRGACSG
jgi:hypothetical protein